MIKLSIIFPVYNASKYINNIFDILFANMLNEVEYIFVDDGSTDESYGMLKRLGEEQSKVKIIRTTNHGAPYARNLGLSMAEGSYVWFFDIDDEFADNAIKRVLDCINTYNPDFIVGSMEFRDVKSRIRNNIQIVPDGLIRDMNFVYLMDSFPINKIYRKEIVIGNHVLWDDVRIHQDLNFYLKCIPHFKTVYGINEMVSRHIVYDGGTISTTVSEKIVDVVKSVALVRRYYRENSIKEFNQIADYHLVKNMMFQYDRISKLKWRYIPKVFFAYRQTLKKINVNDNKYIPYDIKKSVKEKFLFGKKGLEKMKKDKYFIYDPIYKGNYYNERIMENIKEKYKICSLPWAMSNLTSFPQIRGMYLNWKENNLTIVEALYIVLCRLFGKKVLWVFHNKKPHEDKGKYITLIRFLFLAVFSSNVIIHSKNSYKEVRRYVPQIQRRKIKYIEHINYIGCYGDSLGSIKEECSIKEDDFVYLFVGRVCPYKNIEILIDAFKHINPPKAKLLIVGKPSDADYAKSIKQRISDCSNIVFIPKFIKDNEMASYLNTADVVTLPYFSESSLNSGVMIMAFSYAKPVIIANIAMAMDFPDSILYRCRGDEKIVFFEEFENAMREAYLNGKDTNKKMGQRALAIMKRKHCKDRIKKKLSEIMYEGEYEKWK